MFPVQIPEMETQITWLGHAAFLIESAGVRILLDPYCAPDVGDYGAIDVDADIVVVSHLNPRYHSHWQAARGAPLCLNGLDFAGAPDGVEASGIVFRAALVWESAARDVPVSMPYFIIGGLLICHMGDLGYALSVEEAAPVAGCDVLLAVAGGPPTLPLPDLRDAIAQIKPRLVIPMHYQTGKVNLPLASLEEIVEMLAPLPIQNAESSTVMLSPDTLPAQTTLLVLPPAL